MSRSTSAQARAYAEQRVERLSLAQLVPHEEAAQALRAEIATAWLAGFLVGQAQPRLPGV